MTARMPLQECGGAEILARVTYQIILADYARWPELYDAPTMRLLELASEWAAPDYTLIYDQLTNAALWVANGGTVATWLQARIVFRAHPASLKLAASRSARR